MVVKAPAAPSTPSIATATAERRWAEVGTGKFASYGSGSVLLYEMGNSGVGGEALEKKDVGRAIKITPRREMREAYWAERGNGSLRKT
jgi:hypothetical protein